MAKTDNSTNIDPFSKLSKVTLGIRFDRNFSITDNFGSKANLILKNFGREYFDRIKIDKEQGGIHSLLLLNSQEDIYMKLNSDSFIFQHVIDEEKSLDWFEENACGFIFKNILLNTEDLAMSRLGLVLGNKTDHSLHKLIKKFSSGFLDQGNGFNFYMSNIEPTSDGNVNKKIFDYVHTHYFVQNSLSRLEIFNQEFIDEIKNSDISEYFIQEGARLYLKHFPDKASYYQFLAALENVDFKYKEIKRLLNTFNYEKVVGVPPIEYGIDFQFNYRPKIEIKDFSTKDMVSFFNKAKNKYKLVQENLFNKIVFHE